MVAGAALGLSAIVGATAKKKRTAAAIRRAGVTIRELASTTIVFVAGCEAWNCSMLCIIPREPGPESRLTIKRPEAKARRPGDAKPRGDSTLARRPEP